MLESLESRACQVEEIVKRVGILVKIVIVYPKTNDYAVSKLWPMGQICIGEAQILTMPTHVFITYSCFHTTIAELSSCKGTIWPTAHKIFTIFFFTEKVC